MKRTIGTPENKELAFRTYARFGGRNVPAMLEALKKEHGLSLAVQTLYRWRREEDWDGRLGGGPTFEEIRLLRLMGLIERLEAHLGEKKEMDAQALYAYTNLVNVFFNLSKKVRPRTRKDRAGEARRIAEVLEAEYGIKRDGPA